LEQPLILDRYRPLEELAEGGYGEVVLAFDTKMQRRVAIKRMPLGDDPDSVSPAGLAEARTAALLNHPNIATVLEWDTDSDEAFIIMEFVDGADLGELLDDREAPLGFDEAATVLEAVSSALQYAHDNGVLHLDIKPENVLVTRDGRVKVTDFGVATLSAITGHGPAIGGTLGYMPLEQLRARDVDERTDVWALAALSYEILTNANPFVSDSVEGAIFKADVIDEMPDASAFEDDLAPEIDDILAAGLATDPDERYDGVTEFADRLLQYLGDPSLGAEELAEAVDGYLGEEQHVPEPVRVGLWDRVLPYVRYVSGFLAAVIAGWLTWVGLMPLEIPIIAVGIATALAATAAVILPGPAMILGLLVFGVGLAVETSIFYAAVWYAVALVAWWFAGRAGSGLLGALAAPPLALVRLAPAAPMLTGFSITPVRAAILGGIGAMVTMAASAASGNGPPYLVVDWRWFVDPFSTRVVTGNVGNLVQHPGPITVVAVWGVAALVMSLACRHASRLFALGGLAMSVTILYAGYLLADVIAAAFNASATWAGQTLLVSLMTSSILMVLVIAAGPPVRAEEE
jgi:predicted Ser/Thr protein kinase